MAELRTDSQSFNLNGQLAEVTNAYKVVLISALAGIVAAPAGAEVNLFMLVQDAEQRNICYVRTPTFVANGHATRLTMALGLQPMICSTDAIYTSLAPLPDLWIWPGWRVYVGVITTMATPDIVEPLVVQTVRQW